MNGADILCDTLLENGVDVCFANPGTSEMHFVAALDRKPRMRCVLGLFEGVVTGAADGYGRMLGRPAATLLHLGPGLANGLANLHNARQARSPIVNIVGDHATYHSAFDTPLRTDIAALAAPMSHWVGCCGSIDELSSLTATAISESLVSQGRISTMTLPADIAWSEAGMRPEIERASTPSRALAIEASIQQVASALREGATTTFVLGGDALRSGCLEIAGRIARAKGIRLITETSNRRVERGGSRTPVDRLPYSIDAATTMLAPVDTLVLVGAKEPVASFAYPGKASRLAPAHAKVLTLSTPDEDPGHALQALAAALGVPPTAPTLTRQAELPEMPATGPLSGDAVMRIVANLLPGDAIVVDESISQGRDFGRYSEAAAEHDWLQLTGGAIGQGLPVATGAAVACPERKVVSLQADGSAMYTLQSLWTQARESLNCLTIILANRSYGTLYLEMAKVGAPQAGRNARRMLDLDSPALDWVRMANGMGVEAVQAATVEQFVKALKAGLSAEGPFLIEAVI